MRWLFSAAVQGALFALCGAPVNELAELGVNKIRDCCVAVLPSAVSGSTSRVPFLESACAARKSEEPFQKKIRDSTHRLLLISHDKGSQNS
jgi:hypothetical protein